MGKKGMVKTVSLNRKTNDIITAIAARYYESNISQAVRACIHIAARTVFNDITDIVELNHEDAHALLHPPETAIGWSNPGSDPSSQP